MLDIRIALDWTPNTLHTALFVAHTKDFYKEAGLNVTFISPDSDNYATTPAKKLVHNQVDIAICPSESVIAYADTTRNSEQQTTSSRIQAIFALLDRDASAIICAASSGIKSPKDLDGKLYGSYNARYEDEIVKTMIRNDGGKGLLSVAQNTAKLDLFDLLIEEASGPGEPRLDATWIFSPWEGVKAQNRGFKHVEFKMEDYDIPYGYSPVLATNKSSPSLSDETLRLFVAATAQAYEFVIANHEESVDILSLYCPTETKAFLSTSLKRITQHWAKAHFGRMERSRWEMFLAFLKDKELVKKGINSDELFRNF